jgi:hypothetical protein
MVKYTYSKTAPTHTDLQTHSILLLSKTGNQNIAKFMHYPRRQIAVYSHNTEKVVFVLGSFGKNSNKEKRNFFCGSQIYGKSFVPKCPNVSGGRMVCK